MRSLVFVLMLFSLPVQAGDILMILSGSNHLVLKDGSSYPTGYWLEEFATPYDVFVQAGFKVDIATPRGNRPTLDQRSADVDEKGKPQHFPSKKALRHAISLKSKVLDKGQILALKDLKNKELLAYRAVFFPGGHGPMQDMIANADVERVLKLFHKKQKVTALVCHAPAALLSTRLSGFLYKGYKVTAFSNSEENQSSLGAKMKITPQTELEKAGVQFVSGPNWQTHVVVDRELITGQNPASSSLIARRVVERLNQRLVKE